MELNKFIGKVVISTASKRRYVLCRIAAPYFVVTAEQGDAQGNCASYRWDTVNGDPISTGALMFEEAALKKPFQVAYEAYCRSQEGRWEEYGYWLRKD
jgi:hypothetical protein